MDHCATDDSIAPEAIPRLCEGLELEGLRISPEEGFMISRIDGFQNVEALLHSTGLGEQKTIELLTSLRDKGLLSFHDPERKSDSAPRPDQESPPPEPGAHDLASLKKTLHQKLAPGENLIPLVNAVFVNLEDLSYYDLLNVRPSDSAAKIKKAYLARTKLFHPDRFFRRVDDEFKNQLQEIFKQLNKGYQVLFNPESKKEYDDFLKIEEEEREEVEELEAEAKPRRGFVVSRDRGVKGDFSSGRKLRKLKKTGLTEGAKIKLDLKEGKKPSSPLFKQIERIRKQVGDPRAEQAKKFYEGALKEIDRDNFNGARTNLKLALQYDPKNKQFQETLQGLERREYRQRAEDEFKAGRSAQTAGALREALLHYREAMNLGFESAQLFHCMAELSLELDGNFDRARSLALKAIEMEPGDPKLHLVLARAYRGLGQKSAAAVQYEKVLSLDPKNKIAAKELKALKKG